MVIFIYYLCIFTIGLFFGLLFTVGIEKGILRFIVTLIITFLIGIILVHVLENDTKNQQKIWNGGDCTRCADGHYKFTSACKTSATSEVHYFYTCDNCGYVIEVSSLYSNEN